MAAMRFWQSYHQSSGGADIFYGAVVFPSGRAYEGRAGGWHSNNGGAYGCNGRGFGVCVAGKYNSAYPTLAALETLVKLALEAHEVLNIPADRYWGHRDCAVYDPRNRGNDCPGEMLYRWLPTLRGVVANHGTERGEEEEMIYNLERLPKQGNLFVWGAADVFTRIDNPRHSADYLCWLNVKNESPSPLPIEIFGTPELAAGHPLRDTIPPWGKRGYDIYALAGGHFNGSVIVKANQESLIATMTMLRLK